MFIPNMSIMIDGAGTVTLTDLSTGKVYQVRPDHPNYEKIKQVKSKEAFLSLMTPARLVEKVISQSDDREFSVKDGVVHYKGRVLHESLSNRLMDLIRTNMVDAIEGMKKFLDNLFQNPSFRSIEQLYSFLEHSNLGLTDDGHFIAYKVVRGDYLDKHSGTISNKPGESPSMDRNLISDDPNSACSQGLHVGSLKYAGPNGTFFSSGDRCVMVKVNPRDVVCVPYDANSQKVRVCLYTVLSDVTDILQDDVLYDGEGNAKPAKVNVEGEDEDFFVYANNGEKVNPVAQLVDEWDDWEDDDEDDWEDYDDDDYDYEDEDF